MLLITKGIIRRSTDRYVYKMSGVAMVPFLCEMGQFSPFFLGLDTISFVVIKSEYI